MKVKKLEPLSKSAFPEKRGGYSKADREGDGEARQSAYAILRSFGRTPEYARAVLHSANCPFHSYTP